MSATYHIAFKRLARRTFRAIRARFVARDIDPHPLFICGIMGSGTTLITRLIDQHFELYGVANESALQMPRGSPIRVGKSRSYPNIEAYIEGMRVPADASPSRIREDLTSYYRGIVRRDARSNVIVDKAPNVHLVCARVLRDAFERSTFLLVIRDPWSSIEGLRRKWHLFRHAPIVEVCDFWMRVYQRFLEDTEPFLSDVVPVRYEDLTTSPEETLNRVAAGVPLHARATIKPYGNKPNRVGFGVRNVSEGKIQVVKGASQSATDRLTEEEFETIHDRLASFYDELVRRFGYNDSTKVTPPNGREQ